MKAHITKIVSFTMALLVLFSTVSFTVEKHFCGDFLVDISYFGNSDGCGMELKKDNCGVSKKTVKKKCCKDEVEKIEGQDDLLQKNDNELTFQKQYFLLAFVASYNNLFTNVSNQNNSFKHYSPPKLTHNKQIAHQVFII